jgi:hypothetical protein
VVFVESHLDHEEAEEDPEEVEYTEDFEQKL